MDDQSSSLAEFLFPAPAPRRAGAIFKWWEKRRLPYNLAVGAAGIVSLGTMYLISAMPPSGWFLPGLNLVWIPAVIFGVFANACYLLGPAVEIVISKLWGRQVLPTGPALYRMGLTFSVGLALFPALLSVIVWVIRIVLSIV
jgi:hypothetical protein